VSKLAYAIIRASADAKACWKIYMPANRETATFDYGVPAELFMAKHKRGPRQPLSYRRFATAAAAIRFAVEDLPAMRALWAPGCRSVTNASMATTFNAFTRATISHCNGVCRIDRVLHGSAFRR
jgi:hypothetical protein